MAGGGRRNEILAAPGAARKIPPPLRDLLPLVLQADGPADPVRRGQNLLFLAKGVRALEAARTARMSVIRFF